MATAAGFWQTLFRLAPRVAGSDRELLARFAEARDEAAFTELLRRHGRVVWSVCRRQLRDPADVEDAFQATFLVLAAKPHALRRAESLGAWLHGTAWRVACRVRRQRSRTRPEVDVAGPTDDPTLREAMAALDEELVRLPAKYRAPLTACYLLERTQDEAAGDLGLSVSTVKRRLEAGRALLRRRLERRGLDLGAVLALAVGAGASAAPATLLQTTLSAVTLGVASAGIQPLVQGVLFMMWQVKLRAWAVGLSVATVTVSGTGYLATSGQGQGPGGPPGTGATPTKGDKPAEKPMAIEKPIEKLDKPPGPTGKPRKLTAPEEAAVFEIARAKLQIERAKMKIEMDDLTRRLIGISRSEVLASNATALQAKEDILVAEHNIKLAEATLAEIGAYMLNYEKAQDEKKERATAKERSDRDAKSMDVELRTLRKQRLRLTEELWLTHSDSRNYAGIGSLEFQFAIVPGVVKLSSNFLEAQLDLAGNRSDRVKAWTDHRNRLAKIGTGKNRNYAGYSVKDNPLLQDAELVAEIRLLELSAEQLPASGMGQ